MSFKISGYVPCYNGQATVVDAVRSLQEQTVPLTEIFMVDDGSTDQSVEKIRATGTRVLSLGVNHGRGAARARAMVEAKGELVLASDATACLEKDFLEKALRHFENETTVAVFGKLVDLNPRGVAGRWRNRHLFKGGERAQVEHHAPLATWGVLMRREAVLSAGNFDARCRHSEDDELGYRLGKAGWDIIFEPAARLYPLNENSVGEVLERYWRWHVGHEERMKFGHYLKIIPYALGCMARQDLRAGDPLGALISLLTPQYYLWRMLRGK